MTSEDIVIRKITYLQNCIVKKGYFPETAKGIFSDAYKGVERAVEDFAIKMDAVRLFPIRDSISIGVIKA